MSMDFLAAAPEPLAEVEPTRTREALRLIVEVFRNGQSAAADLRHTAEQFTPGQLERELAAIEADMLSQIASICETFDKPTPSLLRN